MTNQDLFNRLASNMAVYNRLQYAIKIELDKPGPHYLAGLYQASGELVTEKRELLREYSQADMVIFRKMLSNGYDYFWQVVNQIDTDSWVDNTCQRLLSNGEWQSEEERRRENARQSAF